MKLYLLVSLLAIGFIAGLNSTCEAQNFLWLQKIGLSGSGNDHVFGMELDSRHNCYLAGRVKGNTTFGSGQYAVTPSAIGDRDAYVAKYNLNGDLQWVRRSGGIVGDWANDVSVDSLGNVYLIGIFRDTATFSNTTQIASSADLFVVKYDSLGNMLWFKQAGGTGGVTGQSSFVDNAGNLFVAGKFSNVATFDTITLTSIGDQDIFLAKYDPNGNVLWVKQAGGTLEDAANSVYLDHNGNIMLGGYFTGTCNFGNSVSLTAAGWTDGFLSKFDPAGNTLWTIKTGASTRDEIADIGVDANDNYYVTGYKGTRMFFTKYNNSGTLMWNKSYAGAGTSGGKGIYTDAMGNCVLAGWFTSTVDFGVSQSYTAQSAQDIVIVQYDQNGNLVWLKQVGSTIISGIYPWATRVIQDTSGFTYVGGDFLGTSSFDSITVTAAGSSADAFLGKLSPYLKTDFTASAQHLCVGAPVNFYDNTRHHASTWMWILPGATPDTAYSMNPVVTYSAPGTYPVTLITGNGYETDTLSLSAFITVGAPPVISLGNDTTVCAPSVVTLTPGTGFQSYLWSNSTNNDSLITAVSGTYYVVITDTNNCTVSDTVNITVDVCTGIENTLAENTPVFPNPSHGRLNVDIPVTAAARPVFMLFNMEGQCVKSVPLRDLHSSIDISDIAKGVYLYTISGEKGFITKGKLLVAPND